MVQKKKGKRGGPQPGSGRPKGSLTKKTQELIAQVLASGKTPIEVMKENMEFWHDGATVISTRLEQLTSHITKADIERRNSKYRLLMELIDKLNEFRAKSQEAARDAAPYCHNRLASVTMKGDENKPIYVKVIDSMTPREAQQAYASTLNADKG